MTSKPQPTREWLDQVQEDILEPERRIIDPHHHLWKTESGQYLLPEFRADIGDSHRIEKTVFIQCGVSYYQHGPEHLRSVGETALIAEEAEKSVADGPLCQIAGIVSHADLTLGDRLAEVLDGHEAAGKGRFRGIRHAGAFAHHPEALMIPGRAQRDLYLNEDFRRGLRVIGERGLTYDGWHFHYQNADFVDLARAAPETRIILDHFGTPLGVGPYADHRETIFEQWKKDIAAIAACDNVVAKLGGLAMPDNGFGWERRDRPASSDELVEAQGKYYLHTIECFGPDRCMFESNFPVDRRSISYAALFNAFKKMVGDFSERERDMMFYGTAAKVYKLDQNTAAQ